MSGLGERGSRLRRIAGQLKPPPIAVFYVQVPDEIEIRACGWYMKRSRSAKPVYLGHSAAAAEQWLREQLATSRTSVRKKGKKRSAA